MSVTHMKVTPPPAPKNKPEEITPIYEGLVHELLLKAYYDHHGDIIWLHEDDVVLKEKNIKIQKRKYWNTLIGRYITTIELFIDGEEYQEMEITRIRGNTERLEISGCSGAG